MSEQPPTAEVAPAADAANIADGSDAAHETSRAAGGVSRRRLFGATAGAAIAGLATGAGALAATRDGADAPDAASDPAQLAYPLRGERQAGIITPAQDRLHFVSFDVITKDRTALKDMLAAWTRAAERMVAGAEATPGGLVGAGQYAPPEDTGEAYGLPPAGLTITIGYGPSLFDGRFGLASRKPAALQRLPAFTNDALEPALSGGDICIQACANDPQVAVHAVRNLARMGSGVVAVRWSQLGFGRTSSTSTTQQTPRNMFGFKDGTANLKAEDPAALAKHVWIDKADVPGAAGWMAGGSYLVARRIRMHIEVWDRSTLQDQEMTFGRAKASGAPLGQTGEFDAIDFAKKGPDGAPLIDVNSHVKLAHKSNLGGVEILRRGYNFTDGSDGLGHLNAGLFFVAFCRDAHRQFVPMQKALSNRDLLNEYIVHNGSALFACPPGLDATNDWGKQLFG